MKWLNMKSVFSRARCVRPLPPPVSRTRRPTTRSPEPSTARETDESCPSWGQSEYNFAGTENY